MNRTLSSYRTLSLSLALTGLFIATGPAAAQNTTEEVIVRAPIERNESGNQYPSQVKTVIIELNRVVSVSDLDLSNPADAKEFSMRINAIAKDSCQKLSNMFPLDHSDLMEIDLCIKKAVASANKQKQAAITVGH
jgi:UrcA family protein